MAIANSVIVLELFQSWLSDASTEAIAFHNRGDNVFKPNHLPAEIVYFSSSDFESRGWGFPHPPFYHCIGYGT